MSSKPTNVRDQPSQVPTASSCLSSREAAERLSQYGPNEPAPAKRSATVIELLLLFLNPSAIILLVAAPASLFLGHAGDVLIILVIILLSISITFFQTYRSQQAIKKVRADVTPTATR
jgi:magnesium-transporting ATPase (P-type)